jgi:hypothetical protein
MTAPRKKKRAAPPGTAQIQLVPSFRDHLLDWYRKFNFSRNPTRSTRSGAKPAHPSRAAAARLNRKRRSAHGQAITPKPLLNHEFN